MIFSFTHYQPSLNDLCLIIILFIILIIQTSATLTANLKGEWPFNSKTFYGNFHRYLNMVFIYPLRIECSGFC